MSTVFGTETSTIKQKCDQVGNSLFRANKNLHADQQECMRRLQFAFMHLQGPYLAVFASHASLSNLVRKCEVDRSCEQPAIAASA